MWYKIVTVDKTKTGNKTRSNFLKNVKKSTTTEYISMIYCRFKYNISILHIFIYEIIPSVENVFQEG